MKTASFKTVASVVDWRLCLGCGLCAPVCPQQKIEIKNVSDQGFRPQVKDEACGTCRQCLDVCPAVATAPLDRRGTEEETFAKWGPVLEIWQGHAADSEIRFQGSSGGALTALALFGIEQGGMGGTLHIGQARDNPLSNETFLSRSRAELLSRVGSRYAAASLGSGLGLLREEAKPAVLIGQPSEIAGIRKLAGVAPQLDAKVGITLSFFCAGSPSQEGTLALLKKLAIAPEQVTQLRYRGKGWPGHFTAVTAEDPEPKCKLTYDESWAFLQKYRPLAVQLWPDGTGEWADISCADAWHEPPDGRNPGSSLIVARTEKGRDFVRRAIAAGYLEAKPGQLSMVETAADGLLRKKREIWGRRLALALTGLPSTQFPSTPLFALWRKLSLRDKFISVSGTLKRIINRKLYRPIPRK